MKKFKPYLIAALFLTGGFAVLIWLKSSNTVFSSSPRKPIIQPTPENNLTLRRERTNADKLESLLQNEAVEVDESNLLASPTAKSKILHIRLTADSAESDSPDRASAEAKISLLNLRPSGGATSRMRTLELSPKQILIVSLDERDRLVWWQTQPDPRLFRAEISDDEGRLSGEEQYREAADMIFSLPDEEKISKVRFYHPQWNGSEYSLILVGSLNLKSE